jgi:hypothetical protein
MGLAPAPTRKILSIYNLDIMVLQTIRWIHT